MAYQAYPPYAPPVPQTYYPPQAPQPIQPIDPFRAWYQERLSNLTFNSRPLIQELSVAAMAQRDQHHWANMQVVVEEIEAAVLRAMPTQKLPLLYLIDSISKNVGPPYTTHLFPVIMHRMYMATYREVDGVTRQRMEEMVGLWRTSGPEGRDLYGPAVREAVERDIFGPEGSQRAQFPTRDRVLQALHSTLDAKHRESAARPWDQQAAQQVGVLVQIGELLNSTMVSPPELQQIMDQLKSMAPIPPSPVPAPAYPPRPDYSGSLQAPQLAPTYPPIYGQPAQDTTPWTSSLPSSSATPQPSNHQLPSFPHTSNHASTPTLPTAPLVQPLSAPALPNNIADILRNLNDSGLLSKPRTPDGQVSKLPETALDKYEDQVISMDLHLSALDLNQYMPLPLDHLPVRCKQCGIRFPEGDERMQAHMDWHFRRNRKERESEGRGAHRRWLPRAEEWARDSAEAGPSKSLTKDTTISSTAKLSAERIAQLQQRWVRVPSDPVKAGQRCPIDKEPFKAEWSEEHEEWIWRNAIDISGTIYHATCRAEQMSMRMAARLLGADGGGRRSSSKSPRLTPDLGIAKPDLVPKSESDIETASGVPPPSTDESLPAPDPVKAELPDTADMSSEKSSSSKTSKRKVENVDETEAKRAKVQEETEEPMRPGVDAILEAEDDTPDMKGDERQDSEEAVEEVEELDKVERDHLRTATGASATISST